MVLQSQQVVVYRMVDDAGREYALSRFILPKDVLIALNDGRFPKCLKELMSITHGCLRPVIDGGLDPVDRSPWLATYWWDGRSLSDRMSDRELSYEDLQRVEEHARSVMAGVGQFASFLSFDPTKIVSVMGASGQPVETFTIDLYQWFLSWATGRPPSADREPNRQLAALMSEVRKNVAMPMATSATSPMLPPPKTTSLQSPSHINMSPMGTVALPTSPMMPQSAVQQIGHLNVAPGPRATSPEQARAQLEAFRKQKKQNPLAVLSAVLFVIAAVGGMAYYILNENRLKAQQIASTASQPAVAQAAPAKRKLTPLEQLKLQLDRERAVEAKELEELSGGAPKVEIIELGDGEVVEPAPAMVASLLGDGETRPPLREMVALYAEEKTDLSKLTNRWTVLTGSVDLIGDTLTLKGPDKVKIGLDGGFDDLEISPGDTVEVIGKVIDANGAPMVWMLESADLEIIQRASRQVNSNQIFRLSDQERLRSMDGSKVTVEALVQAFDDRGSQHLKLVFDEDGPGFAAAVARLDARGDLNMSYLEQLVGKTVKVTGPVAITDEGSGVEINILVSSRRQITVDG